MVVSTLIVPSHTADKVKLSFSTGGSVYNHQRFGISKVEVAPVATGNSGGTGPWLAGPSVFADVEGWAASDLKIVGCSDGAKAIVASAQAGLAAIAFKRYLDIPAHGALHITMDISPYSTGTEPIKVDVTAEGQLALSKALLPAGETCNAANTWSAEFYLTTTADALSLQVSRSRIVAVTQAQGAVSRPLVYWDFSAWLHQACVEIPL